MTALISVLKIEESLLFIKAQWVGKHALESAKMSSSNSPRPGIAILGAGIFPTEGWCTIHDLSVYSHLTFA